MNVETELLLEAVGLKETDCIKIDKLYVLKTPKWVMCCDSLARDKKKVLLEYINTDTDMYPFKVLEATGKLERYKVACPIPETQTVPLEMEDYDKMDKLVFIHKTNGSREMVSTYSSSVIEDSSSVYTYKEFSERFTSLDGSPLTKEVTK